MPRRHACDATGGGDRIGLRASASRRLLGDLFRYFRSTNPVRDFWRVAIRCLGKRSAI